MKFEELKQKTAVELDKEESTLLRELFDLRMKQGSGEAPPTHGFKKIRRNIARIQTVLSENKKQEGRK